MRWTKSFWYRTNMQWKLCLCLQLHFPFHLRLSTDVHLEAHSLRFDTRRIKNMHLYQMKETWHDQRYEMSNVCNISITVLKKWAICAIFQSRFWESKTFSSFLSSQNLFLSKGLVKISANRLWVLTWSITISPLCEWSIRKWYRMSMCLVRLCSMEFSAMRITL
jgi:hypothetical protein